MGQEVGWIGETGGLKPVGFRVGGRVGLRVGLLVGTLVGAKVPELNSKFIESTPRKRT